MKDKTKKRWKELACGTRTAFETHLRRRERPCSLCLPFAETYSDEEILQLRQEMVDKTKERALWDKYGISLPTFYRILNEQGGRCACCGLSKSDETWCVDHDHRTGKIRGVICSNCNSGLSMLGDTLKGIRRAEDYLVRHEKRGGYVNDSKQPPARHVVPKISERMRQCFHYLSRGIPRNKIVTLMKLHPQNLDELEQFWIRRGRPAVEFVEHQLCILKSPLRVGCDCGFEVLVVDPEKMRDAVERVTEHVEAAVNLGPVPQEERKLSIERRELAEKAHQLGVEDKRRTYLRKLEEEECAAASVKEARKDQLQKLKTIYVQFMNSKGANRDEFAQALKDVNPRENELSDMQADYARSVKSTAS